MKKIKEKVLDLKNIIYAFLKEYWVDLIFYFYITFFLYILTCLFSAKLNKGVIAAIWTLFFIPVFILKLKKDQNRTQEYFKQFVNNTANSNIINNDRDNIINNKYIADIKD